MYSPFNSLSKTISIVLLTLLEVLIDMSDIQMDHLFYILPIERVQQIKEDLKSFVIEKIYESKRWPEDKDLIDLIEIYVQNIKILSNIINERMD